MGQITLRVQFGTPKHHRIEWINFIIADFDNSTILGRPALTRLMAVPHYTYLLLKILTKTGVLSLRTNVHVTHVCEKEGFNLSEMMDMSVRVAKV